MADDDLLAEVRRLEAGDASPALRRKAVRDLVRLASREASAVSAAAETPSLNCAEAADDQIPLRSLVARVEAAARGIDREREAAGPLVEELLALPEGQQTLIVTNHSRYQTWAVSERLQEASFRAGLEEPARAVRLARLAVLVAERVDVAPASDRLRCDLEAAAAAQLGNALRLAGELVESEAAFQRALALVGQGTGDPLVEGKMLALHAALRSEQSRYREAAGLARRASALFRRVGDRHFEGRAQITLANALGFDGRTDEALQALERARSLLDVEREPRLGWTVLHNSVVMLVEAERYEEAEALLPENAAAAERYGPTPLDRLRLRWVEARVALGRGRHAEAERGLREVVTGFLERGYALEAATAALELSLGLAEQRRWPEVRELAAALVPVFSAQEVEQEVLAALTVFRDAALAETLEVALVREVLGFLERVDRDPQARFRPPADAARGDR